jgi:hypothetical protein
VVGFSYAASGGLLAGSGKEPFIHKENGYKDNYCCDYYGHFLFLCLMVITAALPRTLISAAGGDGGRGGGVDNGRKTGSREAWGTAL